MMIKTSFLVLFTILIGLGVGTQAAFAASMTIDFDSTVLVEDGATITIDTDDSSILDNAGTLTIDSESTINIGSNAQTLLSNSGTINGPGEINLFGTVIEIENTGTITAIINEIITTIPVGGDFIPLESAAVLLAGAHMTASWLVPIVVTTIGIGIVIARRM